MDHDSQAVARFVWLLGITLGICSSKIFRAVQRVLCSNHRVWTEQEGATLQKQVEQINEMKGADATKMGIVLATGSELRILRMNQKLLGMLKIDEAANRPQTVGDLLPVSFRNAHANMLAKAFQAATLPDQLLHPLKNVDLLLADGTTEKVNVSIGTLARGETLEGALFYAVVSVPQLRRTASGISRTSSQSSVASKKKRDVIDKFALHMYGKHVTEKLALGAVPSTENHHHAGVMFLKWHCVSEEGGQRLTKIHVEIERLLTIHRIRRIQSWGDCYLVVAGTRSAEGDEADSAVKRLAGFAVEAQRRLRSSGVLDKLSLGVATGPISIAFVPSSSGAPSMTVFGDTVNTAARMEQSGEDGMLHLTEQAARQLQDHHPAAGRMTVDVMQIKSKGAMETAWFDCAADCFTARRSTSARARFNLKTGAPSAEARSAATVTMQRRRSFSEMDLQGLAPEAAACT